MRGAGSWLHKNVAVRGGGHDGAVLRIDLRGGSWWRHKRVGERVGRGWRKVKTWRVRRRGRRMRLGRAALAC